MAGATSVELGQRFGLAAVTIRKRLRAAGTPCRPSGPPPGKNLTTAEQDAAIVAAYLAGRPRAEITLQFGISASTLRKRVRSAGEKVRSTDDRG